MFVWPVEAVAAGAVQAFQAVALHLARINSACSAGADVVVGITVGIVQLPPRLDRAKP
jgi:hypothetical protein